MIDYKKKYNKYKFKYLNAKKLYGGLEGEDNDNKFKDNNNTELIQNPKRYDPTTKLYKSKDPTEPQNGTSGAPYGRDSIHDLPKHDHFIKNNNPTEQTDPTKPQNGTSNDDDFINEIIKKEENKIILN